jgi:DNA repair ATPase RecN
MSAPRPTPTAFSRVYLYVERFVRSCCCQFRYTFVQTVTKKLQARLHEVAEFAQRDTHADRNAADLAESIRQQRAELRELQESCGRVETETESAAKRRDELHFEIVELEDLALNLGHTRAELQGLQAEREALRGEVAGLREGVAALKASAVR